MIQNTNSVIKDTPSETDSPDLAARDVLTEILRMGAQKMLKAAIEQEVSDYVNDRTNLLDENGRRLVVRIMGRPKRAAAGELIYHATQPSRNTV